MKYIGVLFAFSTVVYAAAPSIVTRNCSGCHGVSGQAALPFVPSIAGMNEQYLEHRIAEYGSQPAVAVDETIRRLTHFGGAVSSGPGASHMVGIARSVPTGQIKAAVAWYAAQKSSSSESVMAPGKGRDLVTASGCEVCHGEGLRGTTAAPPLAGQSADYVARQIELFRAGTRHSELMAGIAKQLDAKQTKMIAATLARMRER